MNTLNIGPGDCAPYHYPYIELVRGQDIDVYLQAQQSRFLKMLSGVSEEAGDRAYAPGKWTIKQLLQHVIDTERIFSYRLLALGRGERQPLPGFEQDDYADAVDVTGRSLASLREEFRTVRDATLTLLQSLSPEALGHRGIVSDYTVLAGAIPSVIAGHVEHHINVLNDKYGIPA